MCLLIAVPLLLIDLIPVRVHAIQRTELVER